MQDELIDVIPTEIFLRIFTFIDPIILCNTVSLTCKYFSRLIEDKKLWQHFMKRWPYNRIPSKFKQSSNPLKKYFLDRYIKETNLNKIATITLNGKLFIHDCDGNNAIKLSNAARQPCFSPNSYWIAFVEMEKMSKPKVVVCRPDGKKRMEKTIEYCPFYIYWSTDSTRVSFLGNARPISEKCIALDIWDINEGDVGRVGYGRPFFYHFAHDRDMLVSHENSQNMNVYDMSLFPSESFLKQVQSYDSISHCSAPIRSKDGKFLVWGSCEEEKMKIVISSTDNIQKEELVICESEDESHTFLLCPLNVHLAYSRKNLHRRQNICIGSLYLFSFIDKKSIKIADEMVAYFFSGNGRLLLYITVEDSKMLWNIYDTHQKKVIQFRKSMFSPTSAFMREFLFFFDQYALSHTLFSPDSTSFIFCGSVDDDVSIWRQPIDLKNDEQPECISVTNQPSSLAFYSFR